ncbi:transglutaminase-like domain-containing protein [Aureibacter tunicatorum]|uniref:Transglutaminase-like domain-containing protein n=1 Tax=Aureibacter tunicatorum TaxID=866807 RepID=A0AAE3XQM6_9BACT|nr:transglutaminase-like domain-containing protein [Aureibacter tunicatorum]MDR6240963.1 hypothetical protein [Aureibacter tunicatorum]BDD03743.1 hypothetical protein AUTU_12260 [Aureibacter tunicatorum]
MKAKFKRPLKDGVEFNSYFSFPDHKEDFPTMQADYFQIVDLMKDLILKTQSQTAKIAKRLNGESLGEICENIYDFIYNHVQYKEDEKGWEVLHTPDRIWFKRFTGVDCDDYTILASSILLNLGISHALRMVAYDNDYQHIYVVVPKFKHSNLDHRSDYYAIDPVVDEFNQEPKYADHPPKHDEIMIPVRVLSGVEQTTEFIPDMNQDIEDMLVGISGVSSNSSFIQAKSSVNLLDEEPDFTDELLLSGLGSNSQDLSPDQVMDGLWDGVKIHLIKTRNTLLSKPVFKQLESGLIQEINHALDNWIDPVQRAKTILLLAEKEEKLEREANQTEGLGFLKKFRKRIWRGIKKTVKRVGKGIKKVSRKIGKSVKRAWTGIKKTAKKVGKAVWTGVKKVGKFLMRFNPVTALARGGVLLAIGGNAFKMAEKLGLAFLSPSEARKHNVDEGAYKKSIEAYKKTYNLFVNIMQGKRSKLDKAIRKGFRKKFKGEISRKMSFDAIKGGGVTMRKSVATSKSKRVNRTVKRSTRRLPSKFPQRRPTGSLFRKRYSLRGIEEEEILTQEELEQEIENEVNRLVTSEGEGLQGLGEPATATTGAAASGFIAKILAFLKSFGGKIFKAAKKIFKKKPLTEEEMKMTPKERRQKRREERKAKREQKKNGKTDIRQKANELINKGENIFHKGQEIYSEGRKIYHDGKNLVNNAKNMIDTSASGGSGSHSSAAQAQLTYESGSKQASSNGMMIVGLALFGGILLSKSKGKDEPEDKK